MQKAQFIPARPRRILILMEPLPDDDRLRRPITTLSLTGHALILLQRAGIQTVGELVLAGRSGLMGIRGFGQTSLQSVRSALRQIGLKLVED